MHELSIAISLVEVAEDEAQQRGAQRVVAIYLKLGPLSGVVKQALISAYDLVREQSPMLTTAELRIEDTAAMIDCAVCGGHRAVASVQEMSCADCGTPSADIVGGREMEVVALEIYP